MKKIVGILLTITIALAFMGCQNTLTNIAAGEKAEEKAILTYFSDRPDVYENDDNFWNATEIEIGNRSQYHNFYDDATDWVKFSAVAGTLYTIETWGSDLGIADTDLELFSAANFNTPIAVNEAKAPGAFDYAGRIVWMCRETGTYYVKVTSYDGVTGDNQAYAMMVTTGGPETDEKDEFEENDIMDLARNITTGFQYSLNFYDDGIDWLYFHAEPGYVYTIDTVLSASCNNVKTNVYTGQRGYITHVEALQNGSSSQAVFTVDTAGDYFIKIEGPLVGGIGLDYSVKVTSTPN